MPQEENTHEMPAELVEQHLINMKRRSEVINRTKDIRCKINALREEEDVLFAEVKRSARRFWHNAKQIMPVLIDFPQHTVLEREGKYYIRCLDDATPEAYIAKLLLEETTKHKTQHPSPSE